MRRSHAVLGAAALAAVSLPRRIALAQAAMKVRVTTVPIDQGAQIYYAADLGIFAKHGLDAEVQSLTNGNDVISAIAGGAIEIGNSNVMTAASAHTRGLPIQLFAEAGLYSSEVPTSYILVPTGSPVKTAKDLNGKTFAVNGLKSITQISVQNWIDANGGDAKTVKFVDMPFAAMEAVLASDHVDAALLPEPVATFDLGKGHTRILAQAFDAIAHRFAIGGWVAKSDWIAANPPAVRAFNEAMRETARWANDPKNHESSAAMLLKYTKIQVGKANRVLYAERLLAADIQPEIDVAARYGILPNAFSAAEMFPAPALRE
jgi:NitT/TauT family transport system substrate-binding protein